MKSILTTILLFVSLWAMGQTKTPPKEYHPDGNKQFAFGTKVTLQQFNDFLIFEQFGQSAIESSPKLTGEQIMQLKNNHKIVVDSLTARFSAYIEADKAKWAADTLKAVKEQPKNK